MATKLNQWLAIEKGIRTQTEKLTTAMHHAMQKSPTADRSPLRGLLQTYQPKDEEGDKLPPKSQHVQVKVSDAIGEFKKLYVNLMDLTATKDWANTHAKADIVIDDAPLLEDVPATHLLWLEKQLIEVRTFITKLPTLPEDFEWNLDENLGVYATPPIETIRTKKVPRSHVLYEATEHHPAQVQPFTEDVVDGTYRTVHYSGALPGKDKREMLERLEKLLRAVQMAREAANQLEAPKIETGKTLTDYIFG